MTDTTAARFPKSTDPAPDDAKDAIRAHWTAKHTRRAAA